MQRSWLPKGLVFACLLPSLAWGQERFPLRYQSCGEEILLQRSPQRAMSIDINTTEIMLKLGLGSRMIAIAGVQDNKNILPELRADFDRIPKINASYPSLDTVVGKRPDFIFAGWQYGFSEASGLTPKRLGKLGVATYSLAESCVRVQTRNQVSLEDVFEDIRSIGKIFDRSKQAAALIESYKKTIASLPKPDPFRPKVRVFLYDSGEASPFTAGRFAMPQAMMEAVGGMNIFEDVQSSWTSVNWEDVIARKPEFIIIVDYGDKTAEQKIRFLEEKFKKTPLDVMNKKRYLVMPYAAVTPGIRTVDASTELMQAIRQALPQAGS